ncbi:Glycosyltransferase [Sulfidibacter corallicola]|uniref:Glycosyltransferase n=1 Tax=Sulfidibacter corallicola TaxID=2818388 RepID=A0A8A4TSH6_SULCO|nr:glycosyltransferase [Sulfidibacter corallicola]QTD52500.1 glycosyltransferase [Sulfidibacter corallicola]
MISITIPIYNEAANVMERHRQVTRVVQGLNRSDEAIPVNFGRRGDCGEAPDAPVGKDRHLRAIHCLRNFGQTMAMRAGFDHAHGDIIVPMDGDLQHGPAGMPRSLAVMAFTTGTASIFQGLLAETPIRIYCDTHDKKNGAITGDSRVPARAADSRIEPQAKVAEPQAPDAAVTNEALS